MPPAFYALYREYDMRPAIKKIILPTHPHLAAFLGRRAHCDSISCYHHPRNKFRKVIIYQFPIASEFPTEKGNSQVATLTAFLQLYAKEGGYRIWPNVYQGLWTWKVFICELFVRRQRWQIHTEGEIQPLAMYMEPLYNPGSCMHTNTGRIWHRHATKLHVLHPDDCLLINYTNVL